MAPYVEALDDRKFAIGLCELFRKEMRAFEVQALLPLAEQACRVLGIPPAAGPIEGYYAESEELTRLFRLVRALQSVESPDFSLRPSDALAGLRRVYASRAFGRVMSSGLLPRMTTAFGDSLTAVTSWSVPELTARAATLVRDDDAD